MKSILVGAALLVALGGVIGNAVGGDTAPEVIKVPETKVVYTEPETVVNYYVPDACKDVFDYSDTIRRQAEHIYNSGEKQLIIISETRQTLANGGDVNKMENRQRFLSDSTVGHLGTLEDALYSYDVVAAKCKEALR